MPKKRTQIQRLEKDLSLIRKRMKDLTNLTSADEAKLFSQKIRIERLIFDLHREEKKTQPQTENQDYFWQMINDLRQEKLPDEKHCTNGQEQSGAGGAARAEGEEKL